MTAVTFHESNREVGRLWWDDDNNPKLHFEGDADEAAQKFLNFLDDHFQVLWAARVRRWEGALRYLASRLEEGTEKQDDLIAEAVAHADQESK